METKKVTVYDGSTEEALLIDQAVNRHKILTRRLNNIPVEECEPDVLDTISVLEESQDVVDSFDKGEPVYDMIARTFIEDIDNAFNWYNEYQKRVKTLAK